MIQNLRVKKVAIMNDELDLLAFRFFKKFAQYEFSLKESGFFQVNRTKIIVDWDKFANQVIGQDFLDKLGDSATSAKYILNNPPKKQIFEGGKIVWKDVSNNEKNVQTLFGHIGRVRKNLFHGAKFNGSWFDPERSLLLLRHSLAILNCLKAKGLIEIKD